MSYEIHDFLSLDKIPSKYFCASCGKIVYPARSINDQAACGHLVCIDCEPYVPKCEECTDERHPFGHPFSESLHSSLTYKDIGRLHIRCKNCKWIGTLSDYTLHMKSCIPGSDAAKVKGQNAQDLASPTQEMAKRYNNAYFCWSWQDEMVNGVPVLSDIKHQSPGMCAFFSTSSTFEAMLRIKGKDVKNLSWKHLYLDYLAEKKAKPNAPRKSTLIVIAEILKEKGMVEVSSAGSPLKPEIRWKISGFKKFKMNTKQGIEAALEHMKQIGPIVCVYAVTGYQAEGENTKSAGIIHGSQMFDDDILREFRCSGEVFTHAVCAIGIGTEDMTPFIPYQNSEGVDFQDEGFGRVLPSSILEAVGFFIDDDFERPLKRVKS